ncbi:MAG: lamin tail domain-containing protein [Candidatus Cloacimonetes bacterium]|nr:lamin tail domain-containing protein [Candidatus Cloacimonadota bacterium]MDY0366138.1 lamin tail domain-containing protein [Candidatus Syntrophosphaera sp.]
MQTPSIDIQATTTVSVSADVTDSDGTVSLVQLKWGTTTGTYPNTINMAVGTAPTYTTVSNILAQPAGTTVYYVVYAVDDDTDSSTSSERSYTVIAPATTTIPYTEDFSAGWGDTYRYDVAGTHPWYVYNSDNASCNGYGSTLEEHWLVLPAINFNNYTQERMTFNTIATFGVIDANNYLNLMYSSNYSGLGDPSSATWTPIPFTNGGVGGGETPSGVLDLSGISGTNVYLAFKYYSTDNPSRWELDDINIYIASVPVITAAPATLTGFTYEGTGPSAAQTFTVSGADLTADIVLTAPTNYEISLSETSGYVSPLTLTQTGGTVAATTIYARLKSGLAVGEYNNEVINITSTGAAPQTVTCSGEVTAPPPPDAPVALDATNVGGTSFTANWSAVTGATGYYLDVYTVGGAAATDLIISEYVEGTSYRKGLEIYNGTGTAVDLANYSLMKQTNGAGDFGNELVLSGTLPNNDVYVIAYSSESAGDYIIGDYVDLYTSSSAVNYNGNDAIALYNTGVQTDVVGIVNQVTPDWGKDVTLVRKSTITMPTASYSIDDWDVYDVNTLDYLGYHLMGSINYVTGYQNLDVGNVTTYPVTELTAGTTYYYVVRAYNSNGTSDNSNPISVTVGAEIALTVINEAELINIPGYPSDEYSTYQVVGNYLSAPITVTAPEHFEVSTATDTGYAPSIELAYNFNGNIYVRINSLVVGEHSGVLTLSSDGAMDETAQLIGETVEPPITWNITENLTAFSHEVGTPSAYQSYTLSATGAYSSSTLDLTVDGPFEISSSASGPWSATLELAYNFNGSVYVRMNSSVAGNFTGSILHETTDASPATIDLEGTATPPAGNFASDLFFSEYIEGSSNNKAIEIFNGTGAAVDLSNYSVKLYANGVTSPPTSTYTAPTGTTLAHGEVWVIANASANAEILAIADITHGVANYNGDDALELINNGTAATIDIFGCIGEDPGTEWGTEPEWTINKTMVRNCAVTGGVTVNPASGFPTLTTEWTFYDIDTISYLGSHVFCPGGGDLDTPVVQIIQAGGTITLSWDAIIGATYYEIWSASDPYGTYTLAEANWTGTTWSETSAVMKFYKVIAKN